MRGTGGPFIGFGSLVLVVAAGVYFIAPDLPFFTRGATAQTVPPGTSTTGGVPSTEAADIQPTGSYPDGTPQAAGAESATRRGSTIGTPTPEQQAMLAKGASITEQRIQTGEDGSWLAHGRTTDEQRYSPLERINTTNVSQLGVAWEYETGSVRGLEASPIVADGVMFFSSNWGVVHAVDARTGQMLWKYDPDVPGEWARNACCDIVNRGVAVYNGKVYVGSLDGRLIALDAKNGQPVWVVNTLIDRTRPYVITGAPRIAKGAVIIGNGGAELGVRGYVTAYDAETGNQKWRFFTVPNGEADATQESAALTKARETWSSDPNAQWPLTGGGGTVWDAIVYDPALNLVYLGVGNGSPWNSRLRSPGGGDNLYLSSIVAVNADTGEYVWHYQTTPGETWDYTATQPIMLADLTINGQPRRVVMQAPKNGFFYVLDAKTGEFISAEAYVGINWATGIDPATKKPILNAETDFTNAPKMVSPTAAGGHNWQPMAFNQKTGLVYIPVIDATSLYVNEQPFEYVPGLWNTGTDFPKTSKDTLDAVVAGNPGPPQRGFIRAWDPVAQAERWSVPMSGSWNGGLLTTAGGLVFGGGADGILGAYDATSGQQLWKMDLTTGILAPPVTYMLDGEQYVAVLAGWGGAWGLANSKDPNSAIVKHGTNQGRLFVFKIGGQRTVTALSVPKPPAEKPPAVTADAATIEKGFATYHKTCLVCHGFFAESVGVIPDLRMSSNDVFSSYNDIVLGGALKANGMASFADVLKEDDVEAVRQYVLSEANKLWDANNPGGATPAPAPGTPPAPATPPGTAPGAVPATPPSAVPATPPGPDPDVDPVPVPGSPPGPAPDAPPGTL